MSESSDEQISTSDQTTGTSTSISPNEMAEATGASTMATPPSTTAGTTFGKMCVPHKINQRVSACGFMNFHVHGRG